MKKVLKYVGAAVVAALALYGVWGLVSGIFTASHGKKAVEAVHPFVEGAASAAGEKLKESLKNTPDEKLEKDAEDLSRKFYPLAKGALKGHLEAILKDANRAEVPEKMREAGKDVTEKVVRPFTEGLADGSSQVLKDLEKSLQGIREFREKNKDLFDSIESALHALQEHSKGSQPLLPPPPFPAPPLPYAPQEFQEQPGSPQPAPQNLPQQGPRR